MSELLGPSGRPIEAHLFKKSKAPKLGPSFGMWEGRDFLPNFMPGGSVLNFDLSRLTLADFRSMRGHPQVNASLCSLTFMMHQIDWHIECKDKKIAEKVERNFREMWTRIVRGMSQAFWAGYSPNALEYENAKDSDDLDIVLSKVKDLYPEECSPHWKLVDGAIPPGKNPGVKPKLKVYDGIECFGSPGPIPVENTLWYPLLMENGDYAGRKLLKACFTPWYFSTLIHLYANRYYERYGEPTAIGRAPFEEEMILSDGSTVDGKQVMENILSNLRSRTSVNLPSDRDPVTKEFDYTLQYLESQMRGADFERYLTRLDEEITLGLFTPLLLMKSGESGSNNLGVQHTQTWLWLLNAVAGDMAEYLTILAERLKAINFSPNAPRCSWVPKKMGRENANTLRSIVAELIRGDKAKVDLDELGQSLGMTLTEVRTVQSPSGDAGQPVEPPAPDGQPGADSRDRTERVRARTGGRGVDEARATGREISFRIGSQVRKAFEDKTFGTESFNPDFGFKRKFEIALQADGFEQTEALSITNSIYSKMEDWMEFCLKLGPKEWTGPKDFMAMFDRKLESCIREATDG